MESVRVVSSLNRKECEERLRRALEREQERIGDRRFIAPEAPTRVLERLMNIVRDARHGGTGTDNVDIAIGGRWSRGRLGLWITRVVQGVPTANAFAPRLFAQLLELGDRTILDIHIRMLRFVRWFLVSCVAIILVGEAVILYGLAAGWERHGERLVDCHRPARRGGRHSWPASLLPMARTG